MTKISDYESLPLEPRRAYFIYCGGARDQRTGRPVPSFEKFGAGWRLIYVRFVGRKWVYLIDPTTLDTARVAKREVLTWQLAPAGTPSAEAMILRKATTYQRIGQLTRASVLKLVEELRA
jgi:hypothetical protein